MLNVQHVQHLPRLRHYGLAIIGCDPGLHRDFEASAVARLDGDVKIRPYIPATVSGLARPRRLFFYRACHVMTNCHPERAAFAREGPRRAPQRSSRDATRTISARQTSLSEL